MAIFNKFKQLSQNGTITLTTANIYAALVMTNTTVDTENDAKVYVGDFTTLDEMDGANYVRKKLSTKAVDVDDTNDPAVFSADDVTWTSLGNGTRQIQGVLLYVDADDDGDSADDTANYAIAYIPYAATVNPGGGTHTATMSTGILYLS